MRILTMLSLVLALTSDAFSQTTPPAQPRPTPPPTTAPKPAPAQPAPAQPAPTQPAQPKAQTPRRAPATGRSGMAITVTDSVGRTISGVRVDVNGPTERNGTTDPGGQLNFPGLQPATYRLRFSGDEIVTFEREVTLRPGQIADVDVMLNRAPAPTPEPPPPVAPAAPPAQQVGPTGMPVTLSVVDILDKEFVGRQARRESLLSCSGNTRTTMIQLNEPQPERLYADADVVYYVLGGEGIIRINGKPVKIPTNSFASVPRGTTHSFTRNGNRALVLLAVLSGEPCENAK